jgi:hypothetical protein
VSRARKIPWVNSLWVWSARPFALCSGCINFTIIYTHRADRPCISNAVAWRRDRVVARGSSHLPPAAEISTKIPHCASQRATANASALKSMQVEDAHCACLLTGNLRKRIARRKKTSMQGMRALWEREALHTRAEERFLERKRLCVQCQNSRIFTCCHKLQRLYLHFFRPLQSFLTLNFFLVECVGGLCCWDEDWLTFENHHCFQLNFPNCIMMLTDITNLMQLKS